MSKNDFYADPTIFDLLGERVAVWWCVHASRLGPYGWFAGFAALGLLCVLIAAGVVVTTLAGVGEFSALWNQSLARGITVVTALAAAQLLFCQALGAWPRDVALPTALRLLGAGAGWRACRRRPSPRGQTQAAQPRRDRRAPDRASVQEFFTAVRAAGVNVAIARALFAAGIRSPRQLLNASDAQLHAIRGVGPATVSKLRAYFAASGKA